MEKADPLLRTKLHQPFTRSGIVCRPRLQDQILQGLRGPLTLIAAPAGFGKTTLVASYVARCGIPREPLVRTAWLSLDKDDNQAGRFLTYLIAAFQSANPQFGREAAQLAAGKQQALPEAVLTSLINDLEASGEEIVLVLDDYQFITNPAVHSELSFLLDHCPQTLHLLIATRSDPPLPLARLRARGQLVELRTDELRFTPAEASQFLNDIMGLHIDAGAVVALEERTEGWVAGLQMAALSMRDRKDVPGFIAGFSGTNRYILDYLLEEVLAHQPPETQQFLLYTSILDRLSAPLCDAVLDLPVSALPVLAEPAFSRSPSARQLEYLERENLFVVALDDAGQWFRYHHLFADLLKARLQETQPDLSPRLHVQASTWLEQNGFIAEAAWHLFAAQEIDRAADLIEHYGPARWAANDLSVMQMADDLPRKVLIDQPKIGIHLAWLLIDQGNIEKALPLLNDLTQKFAGAVLNAEQAWIQTVVQLALAFLLPSTNPPDMDALPDPQQLEAIPAREEILHESADLLYAMALLRRGEIERAAEFSQNTLRNEKASRGKINDLEDAIPPLAPFLASVYMFQGRLHAAASLCREFLDPIQGKGLRIPAAGNLEIILGSVLYEWNHLEAAEKCIRDGLQTNEPWRNIVTDGFGLFALVNILQAKGDFSGAMQVVDKLETRLQGPLRPVEYEELFRTLRVRVLLANGDLQAAADWAEQVRFSEDFRCSPEYYRLTLARILLALGRYADVAELLTGASLIDLPGNQIARQIETNLLLAAALAGQKHLPGAMQRFDSCLALAEPEDFLRIFVDFGEPVRELLAAYLRLDGRDHQRYAQKVLDAFSPIRRTESSVPQTTGLIEPLSRRELEVLQLMAAGKTNQEIAGQLVLALGTVKAHAANIYRKLDVAHRTEAIVRARQLCILP